MSGARPRAATWLTCPRPLSSSPSTMRHSPYYSAQFTPYWRGKQRRCMSSPFTMRHSPYYSPQFTPHTGEVSKDDACPHLSQRGTLRTTPLSSLHTGEVSKDDACPHLSQWDTLRTTPLRTFHTGEGSKDDVLTFHNVALSVLLRSVHSAYWTGKKRRQPQFFTKLQVLTFGDILLIIDIFTPQVPEWPGEGGHLGGRWELHASPPGTYSIHYKISSLYTLQITMPYPIFIIANPQEIAGGVWFSLVIPSSHCLLWGLFSFKILILCVHCCTQCTVHDLHVDYAGWAGELPQPVS